MWLKFACAWIMISGFAPAGGWTVRVRSKTTIVTTTANTLTQVASPNIWTEKIPIKLLNRCPPKTARGWAAGVVDRPNKNNVVPPKEASNSGVVALVASSVRVIATPAPLDTQNKRSNKVFTMNIFWRVPAVWEDRKLSTDYFLVARQRIILSLQKSYPQLEQ